MGYEDMSDMLKQRAYDDVRSGDDHWYLDCLSYMFVAGKISLEELDNFLDQEDS